MTKQKIATALIVFLLLLPLFLFADDPETTVGTTAGLNLSMTISGESTIKITDGTHSTLTTTEFDAATTSADYTVVGKARANDVAFVHVKTNKHSNFSITMTATPLTVSGSTSKIDYIVYLDSDSVYYSTKASSNSSNVLTDGHSNGNGTNNGNGYAYGNALKVFSYGVDVDLDDDTYEAALENTYNGTVTFNYSAS
jgi:hypothetical protein